MTWIDTEALLRMASAWAARGDELAISQLSIEGDLERLHLGTARSTAVHELAAASTELWVTSAFAQLVVRAASDADRAIGVFDVVRLRDAAGHRVRVGTTDACLPAWATPPYSSSIGEIGGTFGSEVRSPFFAVGNDPVGRGRSVIARALADTSTASQIRADEFELVELANGAFVVVLPGVTDLSSPDLGLSEHNRTPRDLDRFAVPSSRSARVDDNRYAQLVWDAIDASGVPPGADLLLVGHSFGADTALDLAADPSFNGPDGYHVTHVVAAGYYSDPQLHHVDPRTEVLVLQNHRDAAVIAEAVAHGNVTESVDAAASAWGHALDFDVFGAVSSTASTAYHGASALLDGVRYTIENVDDLGDVAIGVVTMDGDRIAEGAGDFVTFDPHVSQPAVGQIVDVFEGGSTGAGHHPDNYVDRVLDTDDGRLVEFFASVDRAGYAVAGTSFAIDISVPPDPDE